MDVIGNPVDGFYCQTGHMLNG